MVVTTVARLIYKKMCAILEYMQYKTWHTQVVKTIKPLSEKQLYFRTLIFGLLLFGACYAYTSWNKIPNQLNKSVADVAILLIGLSMLLSSLCYFWNFVDTKIVYRKHLGLIGFAFGLTHVALSYSALLNLFKIETWQKGVMWPIFTGAVATIIFTVMALISNQYAARELGGRAWRGILRTGYIAVILVWAHVVLLKSARWITWWHDGMKTPPAMSIVVTVFMTIVIVMRIALWFSLKKQAPALNSKRIR